MSWKDLMREKQEQRKTQKDQEERNEERLGEDMAENKNGEENSRNGGMSEQDLEETMHGTNKQWSREEEEEIQVEMNHVMSNTLVQKPLSLTEKVTEMEHRVPMHEHMT